MTNPGRSTYSTSTVTTRQCVELFLHRWQAGAEFPKPLARIALVHGLSEHARRYDAFALRLNAAGIELVALDLRGHGRSSGERTWVNCFDDYLLDADVLLEAAETTAPAGVPLFLMGHSMGGTIAALYVAERPGDRKLAGLILSSPALAPGRDVPRWQRALASVVGVVRPRFHAMKIDPALLSRSHGVVEANRRDPLVHHDAIPARTGAQLLAAMTRVRRKRASITLPLLVFHGTEDKLAEPDGSRDFEANVGSTDSTLLIYEGSYHETMNDLDRDRVIRALIDWTIVRADLTRPRM
ncbi:Lysophospholipase; Monoglyceride lipase; putative [Caballeronia glathei]|jgi:alpha-beta hydrolase superfamily lysophospholipase|uniref:Monoacylglycerol lipase n=1 Tax=Caballeronia glathei TaxID=60547 RepID=A0A069PT01_9BURK|nr:alpha/beta hydrolase [Caballeronia glathei]KDR40426.1 transposase [Caballeronia glathei]CDY75988.1 Lysophospholipase; Monoglyceride lipase; putative [Caballeronia glathei]